MKLVSYSGNWTIELRNDMLNFLILENRRDLDLFVTEFNNQLLKINENFVLNNNTDKIELHNIASLITSPLDIEYNNRNIQKKLFEYLSSEVELQDITEKLLETQGAIIEQLERLQILSDYNIDFKTELFITDIFKNLDIHLTTPSGSFVERLIEYQDVQNRLLSHNILVVVMCDAYMNDEDFNHLSTWAKYNENYILLVSNTLKPLNFERNFYIIDKDECMIY